MASLKKAFDDIFHLVQRRDQHDIIGNKQVCQEALNAFETVNYEITILYQHEIQVIGEMIVNAMEGDIRSALAKMSRANEAYNKYVLKHLEEKERVATKGKEPRVSVKEPVDSVISSDAGNMNRHTPWTRDDVIGQFKQLYDVDWKSAYDEMRKGGKGVHKEETCEDLYYITKTIYHLSKDVVSETVKLMDMACKDIIHQQQTFTEKTENKNQDEAKGLLLIFIRQNYGLVHRRLQQKTMEFLKEYKDYPKTRQFGERCATVTWWMQVQDPPMSITYVEIGELCKPETYDLYGPPGNRIVYRIMPALLTHSNGAVLVKGRMMCDREKNIREN